MKNLSLIITLLTVVFLFKTAVSQTITIAESGDQPSLSKSQNGAIGVAFGQGQDVFFSVSKDNGSSFSKPEKVATLDGLVLGMSSGPRLSMTNGYYAIVAPDRKGDLFAWRKKVGSNKWEGPFKVNDVPGSSGESLADIAFDSKGKLYATWIDTRREGQDHADMGHEKKPEGRQAKKQEAGAGHEKVEKKREVDKENHNTPPKQLTKEELMKEVGEMPEGAEGIRTYPGEDGKLYWVVVDKEGNALKAQDLEGYKKFKAQNGNRPKPQGKIFISISEDAGKTWKKSQLVYTSPDGSVCECCKPSIVAGKDGVYLMFRNNVGGNRDLYVTKSIGQGASFSEPEKLGIGSWAINGCPMDGGNIDSWKGNVMTVWQREGKIYSAIPGMPERLLSSGRSPATVLTEDGPYFIWSEGASIMTKTPKSRVNQNLGNGSNAQLIRLTNGGVLSVWLNEGKVVTKTLD